MSPVFARLGVAADGAASRLREMAHINSRSWPYGEGAIVTTVKTATEHNGEAWQRFFSTGPLALLPLHAPHERSLIWTVPLARAEELAQMTGQAFEQALDLACADAVGSVEANVPRQMFALARTEADRYVAPRLALVGDAAHQLHPLAGQGVNLGLADAASLAELLNDAHTAGRDPGSVSLLRRYERWRFSANTPMIAAISMFHTLFPNDAPPLAALRGISLRVFDQLLPVKRIVMRFASGLAGDLPRIARSTRTDKQS